MVIQLLSQARLSRSTRRSGFTLVELLVVIGIIAILAGVALGPITRGIRIAQQNAGMQNSRSIGLAMFQYGNDNDSVYPDGADAGAIANTLFQGKYVSDPKTFVISGDAASVPYGGAGPLVIANCSYNFAGVPGGEATGKGVGPSASDLLPIVWSGGDEAAVIPGGPGVGTACVSAGIYGTYGIAVTYKSNSAYFKTPQTGDVPAFPGKGFVAFVDKAFDPAGIAYAKRTGSTGK